MTSLLFCDIKEIMFKHFKVFILQPSGLIESFNSLTRRSNKIFTLKYLTFDLI